MIKPKMVAYYVKVSKANVIETELEDEIQRLEIPDKTYKRVVYLEPGLPMAFIEKELEEQLQRILKRMREKENELLQ